jgi:hypothetical protein
VCDLRTPAPLTYLKILITPSSPSWARRRREAQSRLMAT